MSGDIYTFLFIFCKDKYIAEDALHETFLTIYEKAGSYRIYNNPKAWVLTIAKNKAISIIRKDSRASNLDDLEISAENIENIEDSVLDQMQADMLLSILSEDDKKIVILHTVYGFKHREISELMNLPLGTVKWRYKQSMDKMRNKSKTDEDNGQVFLESNKQNGVINI